MWHKQNTWYYLMVCTNGWPEEVREFREVSSPSYPWKPECRVKQRSFRSHACLEGNPHRYYSCWSEKQWHETTKVCFLLEEPRGGGVLKKSCKLFVDFGYNSIWPITIHLALFGCSRYIFNFCFLRIGQAEHHDTGFYFSRTWCPWLQIWTHNIITKCPVRTPNFAWRFDKVKFLTPTCQTYYKMGSWGPYQWPKING